MIANGDWKKNNVTNYISCDAYNGDNTPKRFGLMLKRAVEQVSQQYHGWYCVCVSLPQKSYFSF